MEKIALSYMIMAYNEQDNIQQAIEDAHFMCCRVANKFEILVLYSECSTDKTKGVIKKMMKIYPEVKIISRPKDHWGYGYGLALGIKNAKYDYIFYTDGDNQFDVNELTLLLNHKEYGIVTGKRRNRQDPFSRKMYSLVYNLLIDVWFDISFLDVDCAFKLYKKEIFKDMDLISESGFIDAEILIRAKKAGYKIKVVPVTHLPRIKGESCVTGSLKHKLSLAKDLFKEMYMVRMHV